MLDIQTGDFIKIDDRLISAGGGTTIEFDQSNFDQSNIGVVSTTVIARVEVTPTDVGSCATITPVTSFVLKDNDGRRTFLPSQALDPVHLRPISLGGPIIIKDPKINE